MDFNLTRSIEILERTPGVITSMLQDLPPAWTAVNEGGVSWSAYDIVGHLIHGDETDWIPRLNIILSSEPVKRFEPFNRQAQFVESKGKSLDDLLEKFRTIRKKNVAFLVSKKLSADDLKKRGIHPDFGEVTLSQLLATWTVHDLNHIAQISRVMARQYTEAVGPWIKYLGILARKS